MGDVIEIGKRRTFTLDEARKLLPVVKRITRDAVSETEAIENEAFLGLRDQDDAKDEVADVVQHWAEKVLVLGCEPKGLWLVDFDNGQGCFCWQHGEDDVGFFHSYEEGFEGRTCIN